MNWNGTEKPRSDAWKRRAIVAVDARQLTAGVAQAQDHSLEFEPAGLLHCRLYRGLPKRDLSAFSPRAAFSAQLSRARRGFSRTSLFSTVRLPFYSAPL